MSNLTKHRLLELNRRLVDLRQNPPKSTDTFLETYNKFMDMHALQIDLLKTLLEYTRIP